MIFLSHNYKDKSVVEQFAVHLAQAFGKENVFYDSWSIAPGEGIIDKMNEGLGKADLFFFFVSANSLESKMVELEWQNGLMKSSKGQMRLIPIKMDSTLIPPILMQTVYLDLYAQGLEVTLRQVLDLANGKSTFTQPFSNFSNLRASITVNSVAIDIVVEALHFMEPRSHFLILTDESEENVSLLGGTGMFQSGFNKDIQLTNGLRANAIYYGVSAALVPKFPLRLTLGSKIGKTPSFKGIMHQKSENEWITVPVV